ncbi:uncharacterized protein LY89DRAFT_370779 [Mollisia scopiformis]|uniref:Uncharacterized protein n=1 Tax=Mollisia scopiformis TaxID=149040 RepID=A0A132B436_MOLSC|nr:uncharacterized protein LY89DRAFT_370779 [Mollisia scopiformis]KUJ07178.1 hypothetical protein LY89DRAFT_370779 [Mollisia scopiformis]
MPLAIAAGLGNLAMVELLLACSPEISAENVNGNCFPVIGYPGDAEESPQLYIFPTPLYMACAQGHMDVMQLLVDHGADMSLPSPQDRIGLSRHNGNIVHTLQPPTRPFDGSELYVNDIQPFGGSYDYDSGRSWKTPFDAATFGRTDDTLNIMRAHRATAGHSSVVETLPILSVTNFEIWETILQPKEDVSKTVINLEFLFAAGLDLRATKVEGQSFILWVLDHDVEYIRALNPGRSRLLKTHIPHFVSAILELLAIDNLKIHQYYKLFLTILQVYDVLTLARILSGILKHSNTETAKEFLFNIFLHIIRRMDSSIEALDIVTAIIRATRANQNLVTRGFRVARKPLPASHQEITSRKNTGSKSARGDINVSQRISIDFLRKYFDALCFDRCGATRQALTNIMLIINMIECDLVNFLLLVDNDNELDSSSGFESLETNLETESQFKTHQANEDLLNIQKSHSAAKYHGPCLI